MYNNWGKQNGIGVIMEPDNFGGQNAAAIALKGWPSGGNSLGTAGQWNDIKNNNTLYFIVEKDPVLGIKEGFPKKTKVYPIPSYNEIIIELVSKQNFSYQLHDSLGKLIKSGNVFSNLKKINIQDLSSGVYFLSIKNNETLEIIKVIKK
ncbi:T9SS type A sorting domain-containing protein [Chryseobacterium sp.]|uniref:T9SS type A sorting domain-containing protein n=1 Tax=Chryseobacterium sp. TaxID=1871047 RepID=UPI0031D9DB2D